MKHTILMRKEAFKFAAAHMTVFPDGTKEPLHGHNYQVALQLVLRESSFEKMVPFQHWKDALMALCMEWDHRVLVPANNPFFKKIRVTDEETEFTVCGKRYVLPSDEVLLLPTDNLSTEAFSGEFCRRFVVMLEGKPGFELAESIEIAVEESPGTGASCRWERG
ncbi:6-carboxytetrahydropterin synthase [bacterium]|nr:6-carboxytetrahydropterin synthase [bacterium]